MTPCPKNISAVILAGGKSSRMGMNKAELMFSGETLIEHQVNKLRSLGIEDIIISGYEKPVEATRFAPDVFPGKGPLGGIHAGLLASKNGHCLVLSVDVPLVPAETLMGLIYAHINGDDLITVLSHGDDIEPLIGVYERRLTDTAEAILRTERTSVRVLLEKAGVSFFEYNGDASLLFNCNTPEEYDMLLKKAQSYI